jgi:predicted adenine nucleotide alpha hydrolase (AANH) superfamily ATPase
MQNTNTCKQVSTFRIVSVDHDRIIESLLVDRMIEAVQLNHLGHHDETAVNVAYRHGQCKRGAKYRRKFQLIRRIEIITAFGHATHACMHASPQNDLHIVSRYHKSSLRIFLNKNMCAMLRDNSVARYRANIPRLSGRQGGNGRERSQN